MDMVCTGHDSRTQLLDPIEHMKVDDQVEKLQQKIKLLLSDCERSIGLSEHLQATLTGQGAASKMLSYYPKLCRAAKCWPEAFAGCRLLLTTNSACRTSPSQLLQAGLRILQLMKVSQIFLGISSPGLKKDMVKDELRVQECFAGVPWILLPASIQQALQV